MTSKSSKIVIFGGTGFVGKALIKELTKRGYTDIVALGSMDFDLTNYKEAWAAFARHRPEVAFSIAGYVGGIGFNKRQPADMFMKNMKIAMNCIECAHQSGVKKFIQSGTVCSYSAYALPPFREETLFSGYPEKTNSPYGIARRASYVMLRAFREQYGFPGIYLIPVNMYGPEDNFDLEDSHVIPAMIRKFVEGRNQDKPSITLWGDGTPTREFLYVEDCAEAFVSAMELYDGDTPINIGTGAEISMYNLANLISSIVGYKGEVIWDKTRPNGQMRRSLNVEKAKEYFNFTAKTSLEDGLLKTIKWFEESYNG